MRKPTKQDIAKWEEDAEFMIEEMEKPESLLQWEEEDNKFIREEFKVEDRAHRVGMQISDNCNYATAEAVSIESGFSLYMSKYRNMASGDEWTVTYASKSDSEAIRAGERLEPENMRLEYTLKLILRENNIPSSVIIWGN
jgi:hypothetical protein